MTQAAVYARISSDHAGEGLGVKRQEVDCRKLAAAKGWDVAAVLVDNDVSATKAKERPAYRELLDGIRSGQFDAVLVFKADRLYRKPTDLEAFIELVEKKGIKLANVEGDVNLGTVSGRAMARVGVAMAKAEVENTSDRVTRKHLERAQNGLPHTGKRPLGYIYDKTQRTLVIVPEEYKLIRRIAEELQRGRKITSIVAELNAAGIVTVRGNRWRMSNLKATLLAPVLAGKRAYKGTLTDGNWKPILTVKEQERLRIVLHHPVQQSSGGATARRHLLTGLLVCGVCGAKLYADGPNGYKCSNASGGRGCVRLAAHGADAYVIEEAIGRFKDTFDEDAPVESESALDEGLVDALLDEKLRLDQERDALSEKFSDGVLDDRGYKVAVARKDKQLAAVSAKLDAVTTAPGDWKSAFESAGELWHPDDGPPTERTLLVTHDFIASLVDKITVKRAAARGMRFNPDRVSIVWRKEAA